LPFVGIEPHGLYSRDVRPISVGGVRVAELRARFHSVRREDGSLRVFTDIGDEEWRPFYEAAWELCRIGVLTPGRFAPKGQEAGSGLLDGGLHCLFGRHRHRKANRPIRQYAYAAVG
jgi:hypothetical protein